ncbi:putative BLI-3 blue-light-inducible Bli-3 protein [Radiomyces spectabilis]|uniref:putative BLI-3 blue-light-inducible Bli-3 protein n=1 Tax=Radiomyces spectabilis TaxID=64574 RepID=UPI00222072FA|nr:putative BLI-3 blue-light-inducible Bli-3 protein [Radiomyces spectabilis]KAI8388150.1 putative BLI-3 blue-light-inducible Bli-3 protein [Radiomyces spectabilis]
MSTTLPHGDPVHEKNLDLSTSTEKKIEDLYKLIEGIKICMMTTRCAKTGRLVSRAMAPRTPKKDQPADLWFFANNTTHKFDELQEDPNVNLAFFSQSTFEWVSVSGTAEVVNDRAKVKELYAPDIKAWFADMGDGVHDGGPTDPRISLIFVKADTVHYSMKDTFGPVQVWNIAKGMVTGEAPKVSAERDLNAEELRDARRTEGLDKSLT